MGTVTTEYAVNLRYQMQNQAVLAGARAMGGELQRAHQASAAFGMSLGRISGLLAGGAGLYQAKKSFLDFNSTMEQAQITMAGMMAQAGKGDFVGNMGEAAALVKQMQLDARASVGTTEDFVQMATSIVQPLVMAKGSMQDLRDMTRQTVIASRAMGIGADVAGRDVSQALMGRYNTVDPFLSRILPAIGYRGEEGRAKWRQLTEEKRLSELRRALGSKGIMDMGKAQETSFAGAASTLKDNIQMTLGKVGMPLFKAVTEELVKWNKWLDTNQYKIQQMARDIGGGLLSAAVKFRDAAAFAAGHWKSILGTLLAIKGVGSLITFGEMAAKASAMAAAAAGTGAGAGGSAAAAAAAARMGRYASVGSALTIGAITVAALYAAGTELAQYIDKRQSALIAQSGTAEATLGMFGGIGTNKGGHALHQYMMAQGLATENTFNKAEFVTMLEAAALPVREKWADALGVGGGASWGKDPTFIAEAMAKRFSEVMKASEAFHWMMQGGMVQDANWRMPGFIDTKDLKPAKINQNVTIHRIEVASDDPDRMAIGFQDWLANVARNPANAKHALREAG